MSHSRWGGGQDVDKHRGSPRWKHPGTHIHVYAHSQNQRQTCAYLHSRKCRQGHTQMGPRKGLLCVRIQTHACTHTWVAGTCLCTSFVPGPQSPRVTLGGSTTPQLTPPAPSQLNPQLRGPPPLYLAALGMLPPGLLLASSSRPQPGKDPKVPSDGPGLATACPLSLALAGQLPPSPVTSACQPQNAARDPGPA